MSRNNHDLCTNCGIHPKVTGHNVCSRFCLNEAAEKLAERASTDAALGQRELCSHCKQRKKSQEINDAGTVVLHEYCGILCYQASQTNITPNTVAVSPTPFPTENTVTLRRESLSVPVAQKISQRMEERWVSDGVELVSFEAIYGIKVPNEVYQRFTTAMEMIDNYTIVTSYYGGSLTCDLANCRDEEIRPCKSKHCALCNTIKSAFSNILFRESSHDGVYGPGIYTHLNPVIAHQTAASSPQEPQRSSHALLQCRVVTAVGTTERSSSFAGVADDLGIVYCSHAVAIIPTHLLIYQVETELPLPVCTLSSCNNPIATNESKFCSNRHREDAVLKDGVPG